VVKDYLTTEGEEMIINEKGQEKPLKRSDITVGRIYWHSFASISVQVLKVVTSEIPCTSDNYPEEVSGDKDFRKLLVRPGSPWREDNNRTFELREAVEVYLWELEKISVGNEDREYKLLCERISQVPNSPDSETTNNDTSDKP